MFNGWNSANNIRWISQLCPISVRKCNCIFVWKCASVFTLHIKNYVQFVVSLESRLYSKRIDSSLNSLRFCVRKAMWWCKNSDAIEWNIMEYIANIFKYPFFLPFFLMENLVQLDVSLKNGKHSIFQWSWTMNINNKMFNE